MLICYNEYTICPRSLDQYYIVRYRTAVIPATVLRQSRSRRRRGRLRYSSALSADDQRRASVGTNQPDGEQPGRNVTDDAAAHEDQHRGGRFSFNPTSREYGRKQEP